MTIELSYKKGEPFFGTYNELLKALASLIEPSKNTETNRIHSVFKENVEVKMTVTINHESINNL